MKLTRMIVFTIGVTALTGNMYPLTAPVSDAKPVATASESEMIKKLQEIKQKRDQASQRRATIVQQLALFINECRSKGMALSRELTTLTQELSRLEHVADKKRTSEQIRELRCKLEASKRQFGLAIENEHLVTMVKELENQLTIEEQLATEESNIRAQLRAGRFAAADLEANLENNELTLKSFLKPALAFAAGAAVLAVLHWRRIITLPRA